MHIKTGINLSFAFLFFLINIAMWLLVPLGLAQHTFLVVINVIAVIITNPYWALLHEGIHRIFHPLSAMEGQRPRRIVPGRRG